MPLDGNPTDFETVTKTDEVADALMRAADVIRKRGWCQYDQCDDRGRVCVAGAIYEAALGDPLAAHAYPHLLTESGRALYRHLGLPEWDNRAHIAWNNEPERTPGEVIDALESAARARHLLSQS